MVIPSDECHILNSTVSFHQELWVGKCYIFNSLAYSFLSFERFL